MSFSINAKNKKSNANISQNLVNGIKNQIIFIGTIPIKYVFINIVNKYDNFLNFTQPIA